MSSDIINPQVLNLRNWKQKIDQDGDKIPDAAEGLIDSNGTFHSADEILSQSGGTSSIILQTDEAINKGDLLIIKSNGYVGKAIATTHDRVDYVAKQTVDGSSSPVSIELAKIGELVDSNITFNSSDIGKEIYLSDTSSGQYTLTPPSSSGTHIVKIGVIYSTTQFLFSPKYIVTNG